MQNRTTEDILRRVKPIADKKHISIIGEYGSGKSWLANKIHSISNRANQPFIAVNCYTLVQEDARKKLCGGLNGTADKINISKGFIEKSNGGTLFLKGFDTLSDNLQKKVINLVENNDSHDIEGFKDKPLNVRIIISIDVNSFYHAQLKYNIFSKTMNMDLYSINYPPLRQRREEISELVEIFLHNELLRRYDFAARRISPKALYQCIRYDWPGNVQQLKNTIVHAAIIAGNNVIQPDHMPLSVKRGQPQKEDLEYLEQKYTYRMAEKKLIRNVLKNTSSTTQSLKVLGLDKKKFKRKLKDYEINLNSFNFK